MPLKPNESRVTRRGPDGIVYQWSNAQERPEGSGWLQASKASFPRIRTYLWFRPATAIDTDRKNAETAQQIANSKSNVEKLTQMVFRPFAFMKQKFDEITERKQAPSFQANQRVSFGGQAYYTVGGVNALDLTIKIRNPVTGEIKQVNAKELGALPYEGKSYAAGDRVVLAKGSVDTKEQEVMVLGYDAVKGVYKVSLSALDPKQRDIKDTFTVYPEAIDAFVPGKKPASKIEITGDVLSDPSDKQIIEALDRAHKSGRNAVQIREIVNDLRAHGNQVGEHQVIYTLATLNRLDPNIQYNTASGGVYIGAGKDTLDTLMRVRSIAPAQDRQFGLTNLTQDSKTDAYAHQGMGVRADDVEGIVDSIIGDVAMILTKDKKYVEKKLGELKDEFNRKLHVDPAAPKFIGNVRNKDVFWILRDREGVKSVKEGDTVSLLPGISDLRVNKDQPVSGKVLSVNNDGTVDMLAQVGTKTTRIRAFNRQLAKTPQLKNPQELQDYVHFHARTLPGKTIKMGNTEVVFGGGNNRSITFTFANGEDYAKNEHLWFTPIAAQNNPNGWEAVINSLGSFWSNPGDRSQTLAPSKALLGYINDVYPNAKVVTIARDTTAEPDRIDKVESKIKFSVVIDRSAPGKRYDLDRIYENYGVQSVRTPIAASKLNQNSNTVRLDTDGEQLFISLNGIFREFRAQLPSIEPHESELAAMTQKQREEYEARKGPPTLYDVVNSTMYNRSRAWGAVPGSKELIQNSGVFTFDEHNDRFVVDLAHYDEAHAFLKSFFGETMYDSYVFETEDKGFYAYAKNKILSKYAVPHKAQRNEAEAAKKDMSPIDIQGFYQNPKNVVLRNYQNAAVRFGIKNNATLLAMDQGTGKSFSGIAIATEKLNRLNKSDPTRKHRALIIAPASVAQSTWVRELSQALEPRDRKGNKMPGKYGFTLLMGKDRLEGYKRLADHKDNTAFAVTSFNTFALQDWQELKDIGFDVVIIDESQAISGADNAGIITERLQLMLNDVVHKVALTGTPLENEPEDLQAILAWLKPETFGDKKQFMNDFVDIDYQSTKDAAGRSVLRRIGVRLKNLKALRSKLSQMMFRVEKDDLVGYNEPGELGTRAIRYDASNRAQFDKYVTKYLSPETDDATKTRIGELAVIPTRSVFPVYDFERNPTTKQINLKVMSPYGPVTMDDYPEYADKVRRAKEYMRAEYLKKIERGERPSTQEYLFRMQQVLNDPSLLVKKYGAEFAEPVRNPKLDRLFSHISEHFGGHKFSKNENGKIIIFADHVETLKMLEKRITRQFPQLQGRFLKYIGQGHAGVEDGAGLKTRTEIQDAFNKDPSFKYPIMLATNAAKTGVNLPAANMVINYDIGWNPQDINQRIDRAHRVRSLKDIVASNTAPARNVTAHRIVVTDPTGDINSTVEARKLFVHRVKEKIFDTFIRNRVEPTEDDLKIPDDDFQKMTEELLDVSHKEGDLRVDPERAREFARKRADEQRRRELTQKYGRWARFFRDYPAG